MVMRLIKFASRRPLDFVSAVTCIAFFAQPCLGAENRLSFEVDVRPILKANCVRCHGESGVKEAGLDLRLRRFMVAGGESGPAIVPAEPLDSLLLKRIQSGEMPPDEDKRLSAREVNAIEQWISQGAPTFRDEPASVGDDLIFTEEERNWWAFQPIVRPSVPAVADGMKVQTPIDAFVMRQLALHTGTPSVDETPVHFAPQAPRATLVRRATFDLLGLPPTPQLVRAFEADEQPDAWERLIDRLLASPHYGERWGRHWLDVAGYADSEGYDDEDRVREHAFHYRDYVIAAFNADKPFDQFVVEQLAGDELLPLEDQAKLDEKGPAGDAVDKLTATGFLRMAPDGTATDGVDQDIACNQVIADTLQIVGTSLLGLTLHCAQCHDHRYDPISQVDYYGIRAIFAPALNWQDWKTPAARQISLYTEADHEVRNRIEAEAAEIDAQRQSLVEHYITQTLEQELLLLDDDSREPVRTAFRTELKRRSAEQTSLLNAYPSVANISGGSLYLYERRRDNRISKLENKRAECEASLVSEEDLELYTQAIAEIRESKIKEHLQEYTDKAIAIRAGIPKENFIRALTEPSGQISVTHLFHRGDHDQLRQAVEPASLAILGLDAEIPDNSSDLPTSARRLSYARYLTNGQHPLFARVIVNRIWLHHFGRGLVNVPGDFGVLGERPSHPQLLDWLAVEFMESGWSVKHVHRLIMTSWTYQQSSSGDSRLSETDPENRFYGRMSIRRLESEALRDAILAVSGKLNDKLFGEPVPVMPDEVGQIVIGKENLDGEQIALEVIPLHGEEFRRSVYVQVRRSRPLAVLDIFDAPAMTPNCQRRASSNVAPQSLLLMNSQFALNFANEFSRRLIADGGSELQDQVQLGLQLAFGFTPSTDSVDTAVRFVNLQQTTLQESTPDLDTEKMCHQSLASFCQALLSSNKFVYVE
jgi:hypothetical protein